VLPRHPAHWWPPAPRSGKPVFCPIVLPPQHSGPEGIKAILLPIECMAEARGIPGFILPHPGWPVCAQAYIGVR